MSKRRTRQEPSRDGCCATRAYGSVARLGLMVPAVNTTMEPELNELAPKGVSVHAARLPVDGDPGRPETVIRMAANTEDASRQLDFAADVIAYGCTAGSYAKGVGWNKDLIGRIQTAGGHPATTTATALVEAARALGARKLSIATPYTEESNALMASFFAQSDFQVLNIKGLNMYKAGDPAEVTSPMLHELVEDAWSSESDCLILSCTDMPTIHLVEALESKLATPVISSNQATFWHLLRLAGLRIHIEGFGRLLHDGDG